MPKACLKIGIKMHRLFAGMKMNIRKRRILNDTYTRKQEECPLVIYLS